MVKKTKLEQWVEDTEAFRGRYRTRNMKKKAIARRQRKARRAHNQKIRRGGR